jgi:hypothetical protein
MTAFTHVSPDGKLLCVPMTVFFNSRSGRYVKVYAAEI